MVNSININVIVPMIWSLIASGLGLILYKTSTALFSHNEHNKSLRLTGSIVIAGVIFLALKWATPTELFSPPPCDIAKTRSDLKKKVAAAQHGLQDLDACAEIAPVRECRQEREELRERLNDLAQVGGS